MLVTTGTHWVNSAICATSVLFIKNINVLVDVYSEELSLV